MGWFENLFPDTRKYTIHNGFLKDSQGELYKAYLYIYDNGVYVVKWGYDKYYAVIKRSETQYDLEPSNPCRFVSFYPIE